MFDPEAPAVRPVLAEAAFPEQARRSLDALLEVAPHLAERLAADPVSLQVVVALSDASRSLTGALRSDPALLDVLGGGDDLDTERDLEWYEHEGVRAVAADPDPDRALRRWKRAQLCRIAARDLLGRSDMPGVGRELSALAAGCLRAALSLAPVEGRFAVLGMGKLAGQELNYASDVDVVFVHDGPLEAALRTAREVIGTMTRHTAAGIVFRTDADLRPEGSAGPLSRTVGSYAAYFERWARPWERQAFLKCRYVAGDLDLANELFDAINRFVWDRDLDPDDLRYLRQLKGRAEQAVRVRAGRDLKRSPGGIRDVEFSVQLLSLVHGRDDPSLRAPNTLDALEQLARAGLVDRLDADHLAVAYRYLRTVEHRLQLRDERQTHELPEEPADLTWLARVLGFRDRGGESAADQFLATHRRHQASVREIHERLFYRPVLDALVGTEGLPEAMGERLAALGFREPEQAAQTLERLVSGLSRPARALRQVAPLVLDGLAASPDPDLGLIRLAWVADGPARSNAVAAAVRDSPEAVRRLTWLLGSSRVVADAMRRHPEALRALAFDDELDARRTTDALRADAADALSLRADDAARRDELRRFKRREELRVAIRDLLDRCDVEQVGEDLTALADAAVDAAVAQVEANLPFAVIGLGRFGAGELSYASDLDVVFVYDGAGASDAAEAVRCAKGVLGLLGAHTAEGRVFPIDARLRPEGESGQLARSLEGYRRYYEERARTWEFQSLLKARVVAGDAALGAAFVDLVEPHAHPPVLSDEVVAEIRGMKRRIEQERAKPAEAARDLKLGPGGLSDIEFTVQLLQMRHGHAVRSIRVGSTARALGALAEAGMLTEAEAVTLLEAYRSAERLRNRRWLQAAKDADLLPADHEELDQLGRMCGYDLDPAESLLADRERVAGAARAVVQRRFYGLDDGSPGSQPPA